MKRVIAFALALIFVIMCLYACASPNDTNTDEVIAAAQAETTENIQTALPTQTLSDSAQTATAQGRFDILGLLINDDGSDKAYMTMYGFLNTAENLGYASKVLRSSNAAEAEENIKSAFDEGVNALVVFDPESIFSDAVKCAAELGISIVETYYTSDDEGISACVVADDTDYYDELARGIAERMTERSLKSGYILVYGRDTLQCAQAFDNAINEYYPQFHVLSFTRKAIDDEAAVEELAQFLLYNRGVKGMYVIDSDSSAVAVSARSKAQSLYKSGAAASPSPTPQSTPTPEPTTKLEYFIEQPQYTPNPAILNAISITIFCSGLSADNYELFSDNDIYALCIEPYYEASAQSAMILDSLIGGDDTTALVKVNRPIVYADTADKYKAIYDKMRNMFGLD